MVPRLKTISDFLPYLIRNPNSLPRLQGRAPLTLQPPFIATLLLRQRYSHGGATAHAMLDAWTGPSSTLSLPTSSLDGILLILQVLFTWAFPWLAHWMQSLCSVTLFFSFVELPYLSVLSSISHAPFVLRILREEEWRQEPKRKLGKVATATLSFPWLFFTKVLRIQR